jgi:hypothetical protein
MYHLKQNIILYKVDRSKPWGSLNSWVDWAATPAGLFGHFRSAPTAPPDLRLWVLQSRSKAPESQTAMDRRGEASHRGRSSSRGRGWRGRGRGGGRPSRPPPSSTASPAALNPTSTPAVSVDDAAPIMGTCPDMCPGNPLLAQAACSAKAMKPAGSRGWCCRGANAHHLFDQIARAARSG